MDTSTIIIRMIFSVIGGTAAGISTTYVFNRIPAKWLCDYGQKPSTEMWDVRIKARPWAAFFVLFFISASIKLTYEGFLYAVPGLAAIWILLQIGMADKKYMIIPDQFVIALAVTATGFASFHSSYLSLMYGILIGGGSILAMGILGYLIFRKESMGFGDVKLFAAIGLVCGAKGTIIILLITIFSSALIFGIQLISGKIKSSDEKPLGPFIAGAASIYILFKDELITIVDLYLNL